MQINTQIFNVYLKYGFNREVHLNMADFMDITNRADRGNVIRHICPREFAVMEWAKENNLCRLHYEDGSETQEVTAMLNPAVFLPVDCQNRVELNSNYKDFDMCWCEEQHVKEPGV